MPFMRHMRRLGSPAVKSCMLEPQSSVPNMLCLAQNLRPGSLVIMRSNKRCDG
jgi:hypothetical protein